jgi:hypothetical protein
MPGAGLWALRAWGAAADASDDLVSDSSSEGSCDSYSDVDAEDYVPKVVHDVKTGYAEGNARRETPCPV